MTNSTPDKLSTQKAISILKGAGYSISRETRTGYTAGLNVFKINPWKVSISTDHAEDRTDAIDHAVKGLFEGLGYTARLPFDAPNGCIIVASVPKEVA